MVAALRQEFDTSVLFISHNLAVIAKMCDRVGVLYAGELVEEGPALQVFDDPRHPYRRAAALHPAARAAQGPRPAGHYPRLPARARPLPERLRVRAAVCARAGPLPVQVGPPFFDVGNLRTARCSPTSRRPTCPGPPRPRRGAGDRRDRWPAGRGGEAVEDLRRRRPGAGRGGLGGAPRRDARPGRRVGQRQDHAGPGPARADRARPGLGRHPGGQAAEPDARRRPREVLRALQIVFQNPDSALNRRHSVRSLISRR